MSNNQVDRLEVGTVYEWHVGRVTFAQVMGPTRSGYWYGLTSDGGMYAFASTDMPTLAAPEPTTPAPTFAWRQVEVGDWFASGGMTFVTRADAATAAVGQWRWVVVFP